MITRMMNILVIHLLFAFSLVRANIVNIPGDYLTIQDGIDASASGDTILVQDGIYTGVRNRNLNFNGKVLVLRSQDGPEDCILDGQGLVNPRCFDFNHGESEDSSIIGFTITGFSTRELGGAIRCEGASPSIENCIVTDNVNERGEGVGICLVNSSARIANCVISNNRGFSIEHYTHGGGIGCLDGSFPSITNCLIFGNELAGRGDGGGIFCDSQSAASIQNCTIVGNSADEGGGIGHFSGVNFCSALNTIIWNNSPDQIYGSLSLEVNYCDIQGGYSGTGNINTNPLFFGGDNYFLSQIAAGQGTDSPCVNAGWHDASVTSFEVHDGTYLMSQLTTCSNGILDSGRVDMGYHHLTIALPLTPTPTVTPSLAPSSSPTETSTPSETPFPTESPSPEPSITQTATGTHTEVPTPSETPSPTFTSHPTETNTPNLTETPTPGSTDIPCMNNIGIVMTLFIFTAIHILMRRKHSTTLCKG